MIIGLDGPGVLFEYRLAVMLIAPMRREVKEAQRRGVRVDPRLLERLDECERVRRAMLAAQATGSAGAGTAEPDSAVLGVQPEGDLDLSTEEAADWLGLSPSYLRRLARERRLGRKVDGSWRFAVADLIVHRDGRV